MGLFLSLICWHCFYSVLLRYSCYGSNSIFLSHKLLFFWNCYFHIIFKLIFHQKYFFCNFLFAFSVQKINYFQYISVVFIMDIKISILSPFSLALKTVAILCSDRFKKKHHRLGDALTSLIN